MKNLKTLLIVFVIALFTNGLFAQGAYISFKAGYGHSMSTQNLEFLDFYNETSGTNSTTYEQVNISLGKGLNFGGTFGYMFTKNIGTEISTSWLLGSKSKAQYQYPGGTTDYTISSNMLRIIPSIVIASGLEGVVNPYARFGLVIGMGSVMYEEEDIDQGYVYIEKWKYNGGVALGLNAAIGAIFNLNDLLSLFCEINMYNLSYAPTKGELTEATENGVNVLPDYTTRYREIEFVDSYTYNEYSPPPDTQPRQELKTKLPFGSVGINVGLRIDF
jgi:hypothetical protein